MSSTIWIVICACFVVLFSDPTTALGGGGVVKEGGGGFFPVPATARHGAVVKKDQRWPVAWSEFGEISAVKVSDGKDGFYHLQFITMEPNSLFLPVHLHSDMVFYVDSGNGTLSWTILEEDGDNLRQVKLREGDVYRLPTGSFFYIQSNLGSDRHKLRIHAIFSDSKEELLEGSSSGAYSSVRDLVLGFDSKILQAALNVKEEVIEELKRGERQAIVQGVAETVDGNMLEIHYEIMRAFFGGRMNINGMLHLSKKKDKKKDKKEDEKKDDKDKPYNVLDAKRDVENCNGWSLVVTNQQLDALNNSNFGVFMVNLSRGAMMGPHWNPMTAEIAVVLSGRGMVHVVCPSATNGEDCKNSRFKVEEGDVFVVPRYHPMAQMSFNDGELVFVGFTTTTKNNHPQFLVGRASVFQALDKKVLAASLGVSNTTMDQVLSAQKEAIILECVSCAEEEERLMEEEIEREKEEAKKREEEAKRKKEEEEAKRQEAEKKKKEEEEEARRREEEAERARKEEEEAARRQEEEKRRREEEEEARRREEEARREQEEERKREEEAARQREEEKRRQEEEAARRQEEEAAARQREEEKRRQEEEARQARKREEEAARKREEEEAARRQQEEAAKQWQRQQEEEAKRKQEEAAKQWQRQQEEEAKRKQEEEAAKQWQRQQEEEAAKQWQRQQEEEASKRKQEEEAAKQWQRQRDEGTKRKQEEEAAKQWQRQQEEAAKRKQEEEAAKQWQRQQEEEAARRHWGGGGGGGGTAGWEGEAGSRQEEEMARRQREEEAAAQRGGGGGWQGNGRYEN